MSASRDLPLDARLPMLPLLFDLEAMGERIARSWRESGELESHARLLSCEVERVKYRPGRNCVVAYRVATEAAPAATGARWQVRRQRRALRRVSVAMYACDDAVRRYTRERERGSDDPIAATMPRSRVSIQRDAGMLFWQFPQDRKLPSLPLFTQSGWVRDLWLPRLVEARWGGQWRAERVRSELVSYFPEHSATLRSRLRLVESGSGRTRVWSVYGKLRHDDSARRIFPAMAQLHASGVVAAGAVAYARPLDHCAGTQLLWQEGIAALTLDRALASGTVGSSLWPRVARAIATLHDTAIDLPVSVSAESVARDMQRAVDVISRALPMHTRDVARLHASLRRRAASIDWRPGALLHGDLHSRNVLVDARQVHLIDLDRLGRGPALAELGSLFGERVLRDCEANRPIDWQALARLSLDYGRARGQMPCPEQLGWHLAAALLCERAYRCVTSLKPGRIAALPRLLAAADTALDGALESALQRCAA